MPSGDVTAVRSPSGADASQVRSDVTLQQLASLQGPVKQVTSPPPRDIITPPFSLCKRPAPGTGGAGGALGTNKACTAPTPRCVPPWGQGRGVTRHHCAAAAVLGTPPSPQNPPTPPSPLPPPALSGRWSGGPVALGPNPEPGQARVNVTPLVTPHPTPRDVTAEGSSGPVRRRRARTVRGGLWPLGGSGSAGEAGAEGGVLGRALGVFKGLGDLLGSSWGCPWERCS